MENYIIEKVVDFDLSQTLECGQCFHFVKLGDNDYVLSAYGRLLHIKQEGERLIFFDTDKETYDNVWRLYFDLDRDYSMIKSRLLSKDNKLKEAIECMSGVRILNQDFFETLISFIISQNKQIPHIKKIVAEISRRFGTFLGEIEGNEMYAFPTIEQLKAATCEDFYELKAGFRAPYIMDAINRVSMGEIDENVLKSLESDKCNEMLCTIKGVGNKVANCVSLFSLGKREAFPIDVWIKRIMETMYFEGKETGKDVILSYAKEAYGELSGYAQQYLFYYGKTIKMGTKY